MVQDFQQRQTTTINFVGEISEKTAGLLLFLLNDQLKGGMRSLRINIASRGGDVFYAVTMFNFLTGLQGVEIHTHNIGQIDSGANLIFLAGKKRTASKAASFLLHPPAITVHQAPLSLPIDVLKERMDSLENDQKRMAEIIGSRIAKSADDVIEMFKARKTYTSQESIALGFISEIEEFSAVPGQPIFTIANNA